MLKSFILTCIDYFLIVIFYLLFGFFTVYNHVAIIAFFLFWIANICCQFWLGHRLFNSVKSSVGCLIVILFTPLILWTLCYVINPYSIDFLLYPAICLQDVFGDKSEIGVFITTVFLQLPSLIALWYGQRQSGDESIRGRFSD